ncbi:MAG: alpha/beta fold hydrolase [Acidobacteria bacterium]|nr:alpha/beta fold hydrolase [Acidobacteriota bacterium]
MRMGLLLIGMAGLACAEPCSHGTAACIEPLPMGGGRFVMVYRSHPLAQHHAKARRALVVIHGAGRNADDYFPSGMAGAYLAGGLEDTIVVAPRFAGTGSRNCDDKLAPGEIGFACTGDDWRGGGPGAGVASVTTYDVIDELVRRFADKKRYPQLKHVVLVGHSAGGQFLSRYAAAAKAEPAGVKVRYVVSNPSSYLYLDATRPGPTQGCAGFNQWKYGMENRSGYAREIADESMQKNLLRRDVVYLLGEYDVTPQFGFDSTCGAMAQGPNRLQRGLDYFSYITTKYGAKHRLVKVPNCGHNGRCMLVANEAREVLFP